MKTRDEQLNFIRRNLSAIAACAWEGYQAGGRGFVVVECDQHDPNLGMVPLGFAAAKKARQCISGWNSSSEKRMVTGYDPIQEVVILFLRTSAVNSVDMDCYRYISRPTPPQAAEL